MFDLTQLTEEQFIHPETLNTVRQEAFDLIDHLMAPEGRKFADEIEQKLAAPGLEAHLPKEIYQQYQKLVTYLKLTAIICLDNNTVLDLIQRNFLDSFDAGIDLNERMNGKLYSVPSLAWPEYAMQLIHALKQNTQQIGSRPIIIKGMNVQTQPNIKNWIADYDQTYGPEKQTTIQREEYLARNANAQLLSENEKAKLRYVLQFYDNLKPIPSAVIDKILKDIEEAEEEEFPETAPTAQPTAPYVPPPPEIVPTAKRYTRPEVSSRDTYLEPVEEEIKKPAPFVPPPPSPPGAGFGGQTRPTAPSQPAYTRPPTPPAAPPAYKPPAPASAPAVPTFAPPQPPKPQEFPSSPQTRGGAPAERGRRGIEGIPSTPPPSPSQLFIEKLGGQAPSSSEEGGIADHPTPQYPQPQPSQPLVPPKPQSPPPLTPQMPASAPRPAQPFHQPIQPARPTRDTYLEPTDMTPKPAPRPTTPPPARPVPPKSEPDPRIQGNIVDLKKDVKDV